MSSESVVYLVNRNNKVGRTHCLWYKYAFNFFYGGNLQHCSSFAVIPLSKWSLKCQIYSYTAPLSNISKEKTIFERPKKPDSAAIIAVHYQYLTQAVYCIERREFSNDDSEELTSLVNLLIISIGFKLGIAILNESPFVSPIQYNNYNKSILHISHIFLLTCCKLIA